MNMFDNVFGSDGKAAPLARFDAVTEDREDDHPLARFFEDAVVAQASGGGELKEPAALVNKRLRPIAISQPTASSVSLLQKASSFTEKRTKHASGHVTVDVVDGAGNLVRRYVEEK